MGEPTDPDLFVPVQIGEWGRRYGILYIARDIWGSLRPSAQALTFYTRGGGRCRIDFERPIGRLFEPEI